MAEQLQKISWLPTVEEFIAKAESGVDEVCRSADISINFHECYFKVFRSPSHRIGSFGFSKEELINLKEKYAEFRKLLLKFQKTQNSFVSFNVQSLQTQTLVSFKYLDEKSRSFEQRYIREGNGDWFPDDLLADLRRFTKDVSDDVSPPIQDVFTTPLSQIDQQKFYNNAQRDFGDAVKGVHSTVGIDWGSLKQTVLSDEEKETFSIGDHFRYRGVDGLNRVTDVGTRTLVYIVLDQEDERNYNGPPYSIVEHVLALEEIDAVDKVDVA